MRSNNPYLQVASSLAQEAGRTVLDLLHQPIAKSRKEDHSWVTEADLKSDQLIREGITKIFPDHSILTEESGFSGAVGSDWVWIIDPLDGTKAYAKGIPGFSIMVGLLKEGKPYLGVVVDPLQGLVYEAVKGEGAFLLKEGKRSRLQVSTRHEFEKMVLVVSTGFPPETLEKLKNHFQMPICSPINSVGIKVGLLVRQEADVYVTHHPVKYWDICAPQVILEEAGGVVTDFDSRPLSYNLADPQTDLLIVASNGTCHDAWVRDAKEYFEIET